jgi:hypothetical protein
MAGDQRTPHSRKHSQDEYGEDCRGSNALTSAWSLLIVAQIQVGAVVHTIILATWEVEIGRITV